MGTLWEPQEWEHHCRKDIPGGWVSGVMELSLLLLGLPRCKRGSTSTTMGQTHRHTFSATTNGLFSTVRGMDPSSHLLTLLAVVKEGKKAVRDHFSGHTRSLDVPSRANSLIKGKHLFMNLEVLITWARAHWAGN